MLVATCFAVGPTACFPVGRWVSFWSSGPMGELIDLDAARPGRWLERAARDAARRLWETDPALLSPVGRELRASGRRLLGSESSRDAPGGMES